MARKSGNVAKGISLEKEIYGFSSGYGVIDLVSGVPHILFPRATIVELFGQKSASKTTLVLETIGFNQMLFDDFKVLYADFEKMVKNQVAYINSLGVDTDTDNFDVQEFETMEQGCEFILGAVREDRYDLIVVDTVAAMRPAVELEKGFAQNKQMGVKAKLMSEFLRNLMADMPTNGAAVVFINQQYKDINNSSFIQLYDTPSSDALKFYAGIRYEVKEREKLKEKRENPYTFEVEELPVGSTIQISAVKNKIGTPFLKSKYGITYGKGIDITMSIVAAAIKSGVIWNKGNSKSSFLYNDANGKECGANGMSALLKKCRENLDDLVSIGSRINDLWAYDMQYLKERLERKCALSSSADLFEVSVESEEGESLELDAEAEAENSESEDSAPSTSEGLKLQI